jgi:hypothetical protein
MPNCSKWEQQERERDVCVRVFVFLTSPLEDCRDCTNAIFVII